jgi:hypothetical protein
MRWPKTRVAENQGGREFESWIDRKWGGVARIIRICAWIVHHYLHHHSLLISRPIWESGKYRCFASILPHAYRMVHQASMPELYTLWPHSTQNKLSAHPRALRNVEKKR